MKAYIKKISSAVASKHVNVTFTHYVFKGGRVYASDGRVTASCPVPYEFDAAVSASDLEAALSRMDDPSIAYDEGLLTLKQGRMRASIKTLSTDAISHPEPEVTWEEVPPTFVDTLLKVRPFISENASRPWALCAYIHEGHVYATNNVVLARAPISGNLEGLLPVWAIDFLGSREERPTEVGGCDNHIAFRWADGSWVRAQLVSDAFPVAAVDMLTTLQEARGAPLTDEWKDAVRYVASLSGNEIRISKDGIRGARSVMNADVTIETAVDDETSWHPQFLLPVLDVASHWDLAMYPHPSPWFGPGVEGLIVGRV